MATTAPSHRPWEMASPTSNPSTTPRPGNQLPSITSITALTSGALGGPTGSGQTSPASTRERSSGAWSSQPQSTRSSAYSSNTNSYQITSSFNSNHASPNRASNSSQFGATSHPSDYLHTSNGPTVQYSPGFSISQTPALPFLNQNHDPSRQNQEFPTESRRSSLGSQVNQGFNGLHINGTGSPYAGSINQSSTSLAQNLSRERGITNVGGNRNSRSSGQHAITPLSPLGNESRLNFAPRIAPPIGRNPRSDIYNADEPIQGQAYAFPDPHDMRPGDLPPGRGQRNRDSIDDEDPRTSGFSRRDSGHNSVTSSIVTSDSRLPPGQHRLDEVPDMPGTHHHTLQQNQVPSLNGDPEMSADGVTPYSRTPALRVSHKMAERKRRSEMKDLFENLRSQIPSNQGSKSSKWEILTKASEYIKALENSVQTGREADNQLRVACRDVEKFRRDNDELRHENQRLLHELQRLQQATSMQQPTSLHQQPVAMYPPQPPYSAPPPPPMGPDPSRSLPPLTNGTTAASSMQGIQYTHERR